MTYISPLNQNLINKVNSVVNSANMTMTADNKASKIDNKIDKHEKIYQNLIVESNAVKPNKAKATLIREKFPQNVISAVKDFIQDGKNFFTAAKTGKMDDNSLGRINDFGMKAGGLLIATFLASQARTKTSAIMQYIGGAAFFANMALWPKLFINLPARLVHGFKIDDRYISAQGEKKDFFLDNQFLPWDAYEESELRENARRSGIDYDSPNGDEKIKRKMQKTALQNRTLWMATAGFATPLMTALFGDFIEPKVKNAVVNHGLKKSQNALKDVDKTLSNSKSIVRNSAEIDEVISQFKSGKMSYDDMIKGLAGKLSLDFNEVFNDVDDIKPVKNLKFSVDANTLNKVRMETSTIEEKSLANLLKKAFVQKETKGSAAADAITQLFSGVEVKDETKGLSVKVVDEIIEEFKKSSDKTYKNLQAIITNKAKNSGLSEKEVTRKLNTIKFKYDDTKFFEMVKEYNSSVLGTVRGRLKAYLGDILNPVLGSKDESVYTNMYRNAMKKSLPKRKKLLGFLPIYDKQTTEALRAIETPHINMVDTKDSSKGLKYHASEAMAKVFAPFANLKDEQYKAELQKLFVSKDGSIAEFSKLVADDTNLAKITSITAGKNKGAFAEMTADLGKTIGNNIKQFVDIANTNNDAIRAKALMGANLERRISTGVFKEQLDKAKLISKEFPYEEWVKKARYMIYQGTVASDACALEFKNENLYMTLRNLVYDSSKFATEKEVMPEMEHVLKGLRELKTSVKDNAYATGLANLEKTVATEILNNQSWKKIFWPMSIALVAVTLLAQPFFGNIKNEFPDNKGGNN